MRASVSPLTPRTTTTWEVKEAHPGQVARKRPLVAQVLVKVLMKKMSR